MAIALYQGSNGNLARFDAATQQDVPGNLVLGDTNISGVNSFAFNDEFTITWASSITADFLANGPKQRVVLAGATTLEFAFPTGPVDGLILIIEQDGTGSRAITFATPTTKLSADAEVQVRGAASSVTRMMIGWDGTEATISTIPNLVASPTVTLI